MGSLALLLRIAMRSLVGHRIKGLIVGTILAFGTFLVVVGTSVLDNVQKAMEESITGSLTGHLQLVSTNAKDELAFFGPAASSQQDLGVIPSFGSVKEAIGSVDNVKAVIPMGRQISQAVVANELDEVLGNLRTAAAGEQAGNVADLKARVRRIVSLLQMEAENKLQVTADPEEVQKGLAVLKRATSDEFWATYDADPLTALEFLDTEVAPLTTAEQALFLPYVGTDLDAFAANMAHFEIVDGEMVPRGKKGFLFNKTAYEDMAKNKVARTLDKIKESRDLDGKTIAEDPGVQEKVGKLAIYSKQILHQLSPSDAAFVEAELRKEMSDVKGDLPALLNGFLTVNDANFDARHAKFYELIAPRIRLYKVKVGDTLTVRGFTDSGYMKAINVKLWGTFKLKGLERSVLASAYNLLDIMSFRDLYGLMTPEKKKELEAIRGQVGVDDVDAANVEDALFGDDSGSSDTEMAVAADSLDVEAALAEAQAAVIPDTFDPADIDNGMVLHAAVVLKDPTKVAVTLPEIEKVAKDKGLAIKPVHWMQVAGIVGQFIMVMYVVLYVAIAIIFIVALVIINNSMVMATMDRVAEIGTMRAIGANRRFVLTLFLFETLVLAAFAGGVGAALGVGLLQILNHVGIPAGDSDGLIFLFGGPVLRPSAGVGNVIFGMVSILVVSVISTVYPARMAARVAPVVAMQGKE